MAKTNNKSKASDKQVQDALRRLKKLGLYNPKNPRKEPTRYARELVKRHEVRELLAGRAQAVAIPKAYAKELGGQFRTRRSSKGKTVAFVPKTGGMSARYSKKEGAIIRTAGQFRLKPYKDRLVLLRGEWPKMKEGENLVVRIGNNYVDFYSLDEVNRAMAEYDPNKTTLWQFPYIAYVAK